jgi:localization factor PodJL
MIRAAAWAGANPGEDKERYALQRGEPRVAADRAPQDVDDRLQRMESLLNSLLDGLQSSAAVEKPSRPVKDFARAQQSPSDAMAELGYRPAVSSREERVLPRAELQRRPLEAGRPRLGSSAPIAGKDKVAAFQGNRFDSVAMKRPGRAEMGAASAAAEELQTEIANVAEALRGLDSRDSIATLERAIGGLTETVEGLRGEAVNETVLQPLERLVTELRRSLALIDTPKGPKFAEPKATRLEGGRFKTDQDAFHRIEQQTNKVRDLFAAHAERGRVEPLQRRLRSETADRQRPPATGGAALHDDRRALAKIEEKLEAIAANIEEVSAQSRDESRYEALSERIDEVRQELTTRIAEAWLSPDTKPLEDLLHGLSEKLENVQNSQAAKHALESLERQVADLSEQFERANARLPSLASIEMAIGDLFTELERTREVALDAAERAARNVLNEASADGTLNSEIAQEIQRLRTFHDDADRRTLATLTTIHDVLAKLVDRLAIVEQELSGRRKPPQGDVASRSSSDYIPAQQRELENLKNERVSQAGTKRAEGKVRADGRTDTIPIAELEDPAIGDAELRGARPDLTFAAHRAAQTAVAESRQASGAGAEANSTSFVRRLYHVFKRSVILSLAVGFVGLGVYMLANDARPRHWVNLASNANTAAVDNRPRDPPVQQASASPPQISPDVAPPVAPSPQHSAQFTQALGADGSAQTTGRTVTSAQDSEKVAEASPAPQMSGPPEEPGLPAEVAVPPSNPEPSKIDSAKQPAVSATTVPAAKQRHFSANAPHDLRVAAEGGDADAQFSLATYYTQSHDLAAAARWYQAAAAQGLAPAEFRLGLFYQNGLGIPRDLDAASSWYLKAAQQGNVSAMYNLALLAANGKPDYPTAARWFKKAAEFGLHNSQYNYAVLLAYGLGVKQDLVSSYAWFAIAAAQGDHGAAEKQDEVGAKLNSKQLSAANDVVTAFHAKTPDPSANEVPRRDSASSLSSRESASITK